MKHFKLISKTLIFSFVLSSCFFIGVTKIGNTEVYAENNEIIADYFPYASYGIKGINQICVNFAFDEFDKFIYKQVKKSKAPYLYVVIRHSDEDKYGNKTLGRKITIGKIDVKESKQYTDFYHWNLEYSTYKMWAKDLYQYEQNLKNKQQQILQSNDYRAGIYFNDKYEPKSIR